MKSEFKSLAFFFFFTLFFSLILVISTDSKAKAQGNDACPTKVVDIQIYEGMNNGLEEVGDFEMVAIQLKDKVEYFGYSDNLYSFFDNQANINHKVKVFTEMTQSLTSYDGENFECMTGEVITKILDFNQQKLIQ
jgi:hypothetical protein